VPFTVPTAGVERTAPAIEMSLRPPVPNPMRDETSLSFTLARASHVRLTVHDVGGRVVATPAEGRYEPGEHSVRWNGRDHDGRECPNGVYWASLASEDGRRLSRRIVRMR